MGIKNNALAFKNGRQVSMNFELFFHHYNYDQLQIEVEVQLPTVLGSLIDKGLLPKIDRSIRLGSNKKQALTKPLVRYSQRLTPETEYDSITDSEGEEHVVPQVESLRIGDAYQAGDLSKILHFYQILCPLLKMPFRFYMRGPGSCITIYAMPESTKKPYAVQVIHEMGDGLESAAVQTELNNIQGEILWVAKELSKVEVGSAKMQSLLQELKSLQEQATALEPVVWDPDRINADALMDEEAVLKKLVQVAIKDENFASVLINAKDSGYFVKRLLQERRAWISGERQDADVSKVSLYRTFAGFRLFQERLPEYSLPEGIRNYLNSRQIKFQDLMKEEYEEMAKIIPSNDFWARLGTKASSNQNDIKEEKLGAQCALFWEKLHEEMLLPMPSLITNSTNTRESKSGGKTERTEMSVSVWSEALQNLYQRMPEEQQKLLEHQTQELISLFGNNNKMSGFKGKNPSFADVFIKMLVNAKPEMKESQKDCVAVFLEQALLSVTTSSKSNSLPRKRL